MPGWVRRFSLLFHRIKRTRPDGVGTVGLVENLIQHRTGVFNSAIIELDEPSFFEIQGHHAIASGLAPFPGPIALIISSHWRGSAEDLLVVSIGLTVVGAPHLSISRLNQCRSPETIRLIAISN